MFTDARIQGGAFDIGTAEYEATIIKIIKQKMKIKLIIVEAYDYDEKGKELVYFNNDSHMSYWLYSPKDSTKLIETDFDEI